VGEQVPYFIYFQVPAADIDVNIHPTKTEIKFENELAIWQILQAAVKEAVGLFSEVPAIDFDTQGKPDIPVFDPSTTVSPSAPKVSYNPQYNPFNAHAQQPRPKMTDDWKKLYDDLLVQPANPQQEIFETSPASSSPVSIIADKSPVHYQYKGQYIMTAVKSGLMVIDQHRAHVRILYEEYLKRQSAKQWASQKLLFPEMVQFSTSEQLTFTSIMEQMTEMGFEMTDLGSGCYAINAIPVGLDGLSPVNLVKDMVDAAREKGTAIKDEVERTLALSMARNAAIPHGQVLGNEEMENIVNSLFACTNVNYTPDGKSILGILKQADIEHLLGG
jgi:DNA mismatch repair protein MutL